MDSLPFIFSRNEIKIVYPRYRKVDLRSGITSRELTLARPLMSRYRMHHASSKSDQQKAAAKKLPSSSPLVTIYHLVDRVEVYNYSPSLYWVNIALPHLIKFCLAAPFPLLLFSASSPSLS